MHFLLFSNNSYLPLLATHKSLFMQGKHAYLRLRGSMPEPGEPQVEHLLCSRELLFQSPGGHRDSSDSDEELHAMEKQKVTWYCQPRSAYGALNLDHVHMKSCMSPLNPVTQHHLLKVNGCLRGSCPSSQPASQLVDSKFLLFYTGKLLHFGAYACFWQHIVQNVSRNVYRSRKRSEDGGVV